MSDYYYKPSRNSENYLKVFYDYDQDANYRLNLKGKIYFTRKEIMELGEEKLITNTKEKNETTRQLS